MKKEGQKKKPAFFRADNFCYKLFLQLTKHENERKLLYQLNKLIKHSY